MHLHLLSIYIYVIITQHSLGSRIPLNSQDRQIINAPSASGVKFSVAKRSQNIINHKKNYTQLDYIGTSNELNFPILIFTGYILN